VALFFQAGQYRRGLSPLSSPAGGLRRGGGSRSTLTNSFDNVPSLPRGLRSSCTFCTTDSDVSPAHARAPAVVGPNWGRRASLPRGLPLNFWAKCPEVSPAHARGSGFWGANILLPKRLPRPRGLRLSSVQICTEVPSPVREGFRLSSAPIGDDERLSREGLRVFCWW